MTEDLKTARRIAFVFGWLALVLLLLSWVR